MRGITVRAGDALRHHAVVVAQELKLIRCRHREHRRWPDAVEATRFTAVEGQVATQLVLNRSA